MPTTVTKSIGTGGDYSTVQAWEDACPANLVTADQIWRGELKNQEFDTGTSAVVTFGGVVTDATRYFELTTEAGASFLDNANLQTNPLRYNAAAGAAMSMSNGYMQAVVLASAVKVLLSKVQVRNTAGKQALNAGIAENSILQVSQVIVESGGAVEPVVALSGAASNIRNSLVVATDAVGRAVLSVLNASLYNCTLVNVSGSGSGAAIAGSYSTCTVSNCAIFGFGSLHSGGSITWVNCYSDLASPPSGVSQTAFSTTAGALFQNIGAGTHDLRIKAGSALIDTGATDSTFGTPSINARTRPEGAAYDVGAWEFVGGGPATAITLSGPSSGTVGVASSNFTVGANGTITGTITVTPSDGGDGGTFSPTSVAISAGTPTANFTYTAGNAGSPTATITVTNNGGLTNPSGIAYTATAPAATSLVVTVPDAAGLTGFSAAVLSTSTPTTGSTVIKTATGLTFNGSGQATIDITGLGVAVGARRWVTLTNSNGDPAQTPAPKQASGPVAAS